MRLLHIADLHIGKRVCEYSMLEDQRYVLRGLLDLLKREESVGRGIDALLVAGDLYDKAQPSAEAVQLMSEFLSGVASAGVPAIVIPGNHDSAERVSYAGDFLAQQNVYVSGAYRGNVEPVVLNDEFGPVSIWPIPFVRPADVRAVLPEAKIESYDDALRALVESLPVDPSRRNVAVTHQFVTATGSAVDRSDSEVSVGGLDNVDVGVFDAFDYVAVGHVHRPQRIGREAARYAGSLLKYSLSEADYDKSAVLVTMGAKGEEPGIELVPLKPLHDLRRIKGPLNELVSDRVVAAADSQDYLHVVLTDEHPVANAMARLREAYPNVMNIEYDNARTRAAGVAADAAAPDDNLDPFELFCDFYKSQNGEGLSELQRKVVTDELQSAGVM